MTQDSRVDACVGVDRIAKPGEPFGVGSVLARVHARDEASAEAAVARLKGAFHHQSDPLDPPPLIVECL